nr:protein trichome birefringence-like 19 [Lolium perenne]
MESILGWRWQPHGCDLPRFDAAAFLRLVRGKSMAFVGDSVACNHMQSLMCLLAKVEYPMEIEPRGCVHCTRKYHYREHDFTVCVFWTPFLVRWNLTHGGQSFIDPHNVYLDEADPEWSGDAAGYDYAVLSGAKWFTRPTVLYEGGRILGCANVDGCEAAHNATDVAPDYALWWWSGRWRRRTTFHAAQVEEFRTAASAASAARFVLMDVSEMMQMRGDGHPGQYGHWPHEKVGFGIDCVHWCLPGPVDAWNELLLHLLLSG